MHNRYLAPTDLGRTVLSVTDYGNDLYVAVAVAARFPTPSVILVGQSVTLSQDVTVEPRMVLVVGNGAVITVENTYTLTINGLIDAGPYQIFDTSPGGTVSGSIKNDAISPMWFGAVGDASTDDTDAVQAALDLASSAKDAAGTYRGVVDLGQRIYGITGVTMAASIMLKNGGLQMIKSDVAGIALTINPVLGPFYLEDVQVTTDETGLDHTGIKVIRGLYGAMNRVSSAYFNRGLHLEGTYLSSFNDMNLGGNRFAGLYCWTYDTGAVRDSCSSCTFTNCSFQSLSPSGTDYGVYAPVDDTSKRSTVNFRFDRCLFQSAYSVTPILLQDSLYSTVDNCYFEAAAIWTILVDGGQVVRVMRNQVNSGNIGFTSDCTDCVYAYNIIPGSSEVVDSGTNTTVWANRVSLNEFDLGTALDNSILNSPTIRGPTVSGQVAWTHGDDLISGRRSVYGPFFEEVCFETSFTAGDSDDHNVLVFTIPAAYTGGMVAVDYQINTNYGRGYEAGRLIVGLGVYTGAPASGVVSEVDSVLVPTGNETITTTWDCTASGLDINLVANVDSNVSPSTAYCRGIARCISARYNLGLTDNAITIRRGEPDV
jgi:hypothetical protein